MSHIMYTHKLYIATGIFVLSQILFKIWGFEKGEMEVEHPVYLAQQERYSNASLNEIAFLTV